MLNYDETKNHFTLLHPLNTEQRKSYHRENRYLAPNPIVISPKEETFQIDSGMVIVELVDEAGYPVLDDPSGKVKYLESSSVEGLKQWINPKDNTAKFCLKVRIRGNSHLISCRLWRIQGHPNSVSSSPLITSKKMEPLEEKLSSPIHLLYTTTKRRGV
jgi:hypothetical protein